MISEDDIIEYSENFSSEESTVLKKLSRETYLKIVFPRMISGKLQGNFIKMISCMIKPEKILEIGTFTGYSAICFAEGLSENGIMHTIEVNPELEDIVLKYFNEAGVANKIYLHIGNAIDVIPTIDGLFDLVFIDADKENYLNYYNLVFDKVKKCGFIIADNVLWDGKVILKPTPTDKETLGIIEFNEFVKNDKRVEKVLLPLRDGLMMIRKL